MSIFPFVKFLITGRPLNLYIFNFSPMPTEIPELPGKEKLPYTGRYDPQAVCTADDVYRSFDTIGSHG